MIAFLQQYFKSIIFKKHAQVTLHELSYKFIGGIGDDN